MDANPKNPPYIEVPHTADIALDVYGNSLQELFKHAAQGMYSLLEISSSGEWIENRNISFQEEDPESLLITFLSELLFYAEADGLWASEIHIVVAKTKLRGNLEMKGIRQYFQPIKAVTYHDLRISRNGSGLKTRIVFDI